jgi:hypothetical protein
MTPRNRFAPGGTHSVYVTPSFNSPALVEGS